MRLAVALGQSMKKLPTQSPFAWWSTPAQRAMRKLVPEPIPGLRRRPFTHTNTYLRTNAALAAPTAKVLEFKGRKA